MSPLFSISVNAVDSTMRIVMSGFFEGPDIARFVDALGTAHRQLRCGANQHCTLVEIRGMAIQSGASVDAFASLISNARYASRRIAFIVPAGLAYSQIRRAAAGRGAQFYTSAEEAELWIRSCATNADVSNEMRTRHV